MFSFPTKSPQGDGNHDFLLCFGCIVAGSQAFPTKSPQGDGNGVKERRMKNKIGKGVAGETLKRSA